MKKIFTFCAAVLASMAMMAQTTAFLWQYDGSSVYGDGSNNGVFEVTPAASTGSIAFITYEKKKTSADGTSAYAESVTDADLKPAITKVCKLGNNGAHMRISPASGNFIAGDSIFICGYKDFIVSTSTDPTSTSKIISANGGATIIAAALATGSEKGACEVGYVVLPEDFVETNQIYISRANGSSAGIAAIKVVRPEQREVDHVDVTLGGVAVNGKALGELDMATLYGALTLNLAAEYVEAPTVTFTVQTDTYYVGEEKPSTKSEKIDVVAALNPDGKWQAQQTVGEQTYTITAVKPATVTITYMDGATVLGEETVKTGELSTKHAEFETKPLAKFEGWFKDAELTVPADLTAAVNADLTLYAKFVKAYAQSINIEQLVLDEGTKADIASILTNRGFAYAHIDALDTLNDLEKKDNRNYAFLGLKLKTAGAYIQFNLQAGKTLAVKFGNLTKPVAVTIDGVAQADHTEGAFLLEEAEADRLIELKTTDKSTVVLQQIMIGEAIADVILPAPGAYAITLSAENGTLEAAWEGKTDKKVNVPVGATVTLTVTPAEGYKVGTVTVNEVALEAVGGVYSFTMPAQAANVVATFVEESGTGITNTEAVVKAVKVVREGKLFIEKNGVLYNAQGNVVK